MIDYILLRIAKTSILSRFDNVYIIDKDRLLFEYPFLKEKGAVFVTLDYAQKLRGCIGTIIPYQTLLDDVINNALGAAFSDPRFSPLNTSEFDTLTLEVSVLTTPKPLEYSDYEDLKSKIRPHTDGLILKYGQYQGTFLPQVWEELPSAHDFLEHLAYKANANPTIYQHHPDIFLYQVEAIKEDFNEILSI